MNLRVALCVPRARVSGSTTENLTVSGAAAVTFAEVATALEPAAEATSRAATGATKKAGWFRRTVGGMIAGFAREAEKSLVEESEQAGKDAGPAARKWLKRVVYGGGAIGLPALIQAFPGAFHWLEAIKPLLGLH